MAKKNLKYVAHHKKEVRRLCKIISELAESKVEKALRSGMIADDSQFLNKTSLLAMCLIEDAAKDFVIRSSDFRKEASNIQLIL